MKQLLLMSFFFIFACNSIYNVGTHNVKKKEVKPFSDKNGDWKLDREFSDEFNKTVLDKKKNDINNNCFILLNFNYYYYYYYYVSKFIL